MTAALEINDLTFAYPDGRQALNDVNLKVNRGERVALLGPNGAGKTTLVMHLNGILTSETGEVKVAGINVERNNLFEVRKRVGLVFQDPDDQLFMTTVRDDVAFGPANIGLTGLELEEEKKQLTQPPPIKKTTKKVIEVEEEEEEEVIVKKQPKKINNTSLDQEVSMLSIQQKLKLERQKMLMNTLSPMC